MQTIKKLLKGKGMTQKTLARKIGISVTYLSEIENGKSKPSLKLLARIAAALNVSINDLLGGDDDRNYQ